jgi:hypothetical protein
MGKVILFKNVFLNSRTKTKKKSYRASIKIYKGCPLRESCLGKVNAKQFTVTYYRPEYERNSQRVESSEGPYMKSKRQRIVAPVFGSLTQFMGLRKTNTIGLKQANKVMHLSAIAYNLKKSLKFVQKRVKSGARNKVSTVFVKMMRHRLKRLLVSHSNSHLYYAK